MTPTPHRRRRGDLTPNLGLWRALGDGRLMRRILEDFYAQVYQDARLAPFFAGTTIARAIEKQHSFLMEIFTGERVYFGERPRNAHHWMVISDELFDHREALMERTLRAHGLSDQHVADWRRVEEVFRKQIVKSAPVPRKIRGVELPLEGYADERLTVGALCDGCAREIAPGEPVRYHVRTGRTYCGACAPASSGPPAPP